MKILIGDHHHIDFDGPINATDEQIRDIMQFFYGNFLENVIEIDEESEFRDDRLGDKLFRKEWSPSEYAELVRINENTEELVDGLGRSHMSIDMQRIDWLEDLFRFVRRNNLQLFTNNIEEIVERYIENEKNIKLLKKERKRKIKELTKKVEKLKEKLEKRRQLKEGFAGWSGVDENYGESQKELLDAEEELDRYQKLEEK